MIEGVRSHRSLPGWSENQLCMVRLSLIVSNSFHIWHIVCLPLPHDPKIKIICFPLTQGHIRPFPRPPGLNCHLFLIPVPPLVFRLNLACYTWCRFALSALRMWGGGLGADIRSYHLEQETHRHNEVIIGVLVSHGPRNGNGGRKMLIKMWSVGHRASL